MRKDAGAEVLSVQEATDLADLLSSLKYLVCKDFDPQGRGEDFRTFDRPRNKREPSPAALRVLTHGGWWMPKAAALLLFVSLLDI